MRDTYKIRSKLVDIVTAGSQKITLWGPQRTPLGILRVKYVKLLTPNNTITFNNPFSTSQGTHSVRVTMNLRFWEIIAVC